MKNKMCSNLQDLVKFMEEHFHIRGVLGDRRTRTISNARAVIMYILRKKHHLSLHEIADLFGRDHTTVIHNCKKIQNILDKKTDGNIIDAVNSCITSLIVEI